MMSLGEGVEPLASSPEATEVENVVRKVHTEPLVSSQYPIMFPEEVVCQILEFALDDQGKDYHSLSLVSKQWKRIVEILEPPIICRFKRHFSSETAGENDGELVRALLNALSNSKSTLYIPRDGVSSYNKTTIKEPLSWKLKPRFHVLLLCYIHELTKMPTFVKKLYDTSMKFIKGISMITAHEMWKTLQILRRNAHSLSSSSSSSSSAASRRFTITRTDSENPHLVQVRAVLEELWQQASGWARILDTVMDIISMTTREHIHNRGDIQGIRQWALSYLSSRMLKEMTNTFFLEEVSFTGASQRFSGIWESITSMFKDSMSAKDCHRASTDRRLLLACLNACDAVQILPDYKPPKMTRDTHHSFWKEYNSVKISLKSTLDLAMKEEVAQNTFSDEGKYDQSNLVFVLPGGTRRELPVHGNAFQSSGMLRKLRPRAGEEIRIPSHIRMFAKADLFSKALEFYDMDEKRPCPDIARPMLSRSLQDLVGAEYEAFLSTMDSNGLQELAEVASVMHWSKLLSLCEAGLFCFYPLEFELLNFTLSIQALARSVENLARSIQRFVSTAQQQGVW